MTVNEGNFYLKTWCKEYRCGPNHICVFRRKTLHALRPDEVAVVVATILIRYFDATQDHKR